MTVVFVIGAAISLNLLTNHSPPLFLTFTKVSKAISPEHWCVLCNIKDKNPGFDSLLLSLLSSKSFKLV